MAYYVYILTNHRKTVLYTGITNDLVRRTIEHKEKKFHGFTRRYNVNCLVYFESHDLVEAAIKREKQIKGWMRWKKVRLISGFNPGWQDLFDHITR